MINKLQFQPPVIAHRGASGYAPENTMISFLKAAQLGIKWVEFDVMLTSDNLPIVFHDEELDRITNGHGFVGDYSLAQLRTLDAGAWRDPIFSGERICSLQQVLAFMQHANMYANIEIKPLPGQDKVTVLQALKVIQSYYPAPNPAILFSSFSIESLRILREQSADCQMGLLMHDWMPDWEVVCDSLNCISVHMYDEILTAERARAIKRTGRVLLCYTVNNVDRAKELYAWGVDAVFSDFPDKILNESR